MNIDIVPVRKGALEHFQGQQIIATTVVAPGYLSIYLIAAFPSFAKWSFGFNRISLNGSRARVDQVTVLKRPVHHARNMPATRAISVYHLTHPSLEWRNSVEEGLDPSEGLE